MSGMLRRQARCGWACKCKLLLKAVSEREYWMEIILSHMCIERPNTDAPSPRSMRCKRLEAEGSVRLLYLWCDTWLPNWANSVTRGWKWLKRAQSSLRSSVGRGRRDWRLRGEGSEGNATGMRGIGRELTKNWGKYWGALPSDWKLAITNDRLTLNTIYLVRASLQP